MRIFIDKQIKHRFAQRLIPAWKNLGHDASDKPGGCDIHLCFIRRYNETKLPLVQRLDGVYYNKAENYNKRNAGHSRLHAIANGIIYQSEHSKLMCEKYLARRTTKNTAVIYNGIEPNWCGGFERHKEFNVIVSAKWRRHKRLQETIDVFLEFQRTHKDAYLHIFGKLHDNKMVRHKNIQYYGMVSFDILKRVYKKGDVFIHLSKRDSCPNAVVEAIGSGIPIITTETCGGATEMARMTEGCIICGNDPDTLEPVFNYKDPHNVLSKELFQQLVHSLDEVYKSRHKVDLVKDLNITYVAKKYIKVFKEAMRHGR